MEMRRAGIVQVAHEGFRRREVGQFERDGHALERGRLARSDFPLRFYSGRHSLYLPPGDGLRHRLLRQRGIACGQGDKGQRRQPEGRWQPETQNPSASPGRLPVK